MTGPATLRVHDGDLGAEELAGILRQHLIAAKAARAMPAPAPGGSSGPFGVPSPQDQKILAAAERWARLLEEAAAAVKHGEGAAAADETALTTAAAALYRAVQDRLRARRIASAMRPGGRAIN